ncbi:MAG: MoaD family protein [Candidatus Calescibacterium sp.]|nr:MoaD family protein [Candidatus Calescibacterium sp.]MCX7734547.1 MoaD family protein [bacterium]MDW8087629.1 ubiquitin-like small modifier protein 1 [Candidatus Calescibacterium sp.]
MPKVKIPGPLRKLVGNKDEINVEGKTLKEVIENLGAINPEIKARIVDEKGEIRRFINVYVNNEDIRFINGIDTEVKDSDEITIIPAIAGGTN